MGPVTSFGTTYKSETNMHLLFEHYRESQGYFKQRMMVVGAKGDWVHCELVFDEVNNRRASCWGSEGMEFENWKNITRPQNFELYPIPSQNWKEAYEFMESHVGIPYDKIGVLGMVYKIPFMQSQHRKFCSELCFEAVKQFTNIELPSVLPNTVSPLNLRRWIINAGISPIASTALNK
jgi:hypothetical protein